MVTSRPSCSANKDVLNAQEFAIAFVISVTETSDDHQNWIAKKGEDSIFAILHNVFPEVIFSLQRRKDPNTISSKMWQCKTKHSI